MDAYLDTVKRLEPDIAMIDLGAGLASIAISLKRIADALNAKPIKMYKISTDEMVLATQEDFDEYAGLVQEISRRFPEDLVFARRAIRERKK